MRNFVKLDTAPLNSPLSLFSASCHPQTVKHCNENPLPCHPFPLKLLPTCENIGLQSRLHPIHAPRCTPPSPKSHVIPPGPHSSTAQKPRNINDLISKPETPSGELRAKLLSCTTVPGAPRSEAAAWPGHSHQNHRRRRCGGRRQCQDTRARPIGGRRGVCGAWPRCRWAAAGHGRASRSTTPSEARVWRSRGRPGPTAPGTPAAQQATPEIWRDHSHNRQSPWRLLHNSPHGSSPRRPRHISYDVRPVAPYARSYRLG